MTPLDAPSLQQIMTACVSDSASFFGKCGEWPLTWAEEFIAQSPTSRVLTQDGSALAFFQIPPIRPPSAPLVSGTPEEIHVGNELRERKRVTFRVTAAGVRDDLLPPEDAVLVFRTMMYEGFKAARELGYQYVEAWAPWEGHPWMARKFTDYPGCERIEPVVRSEDGEREIHILRWKLDEAIAALETEDRAHVA